MINGLTVLFLAVTSFFVWVFSSSRMKKEIRYLEVVIIGKNYVVLRDLDSKEIISLKGG